MIEAARRLFRGRGRSVSESELPAKAVTVIDNYEANLNIASALSQVYRFKLYAFWQPMLLYGHKPLVPFEKQIAALDATGGQRVATASFMSAYHEAEQRATTAGFVFLAGAFDATAEPVYIDEVHLGPRGNELLADTIAKYVHDHLAGIEFRSH
jgi:hypothetical protein